MRYSNVDNGEIKLTSPGRSPHRRREALYWLYSFLKPHRLDITYLTLVSLFTTGLLICQPYLTKLIIDEGLLNKDFSALLNYSVILLFIGVITTLLSGYNRVKHTRLSGAVLFALREDVYEYLQRLPALFYQKERTGDIISRMDRDVAEIQRFAVDTLFATFSAVLSLTGAIAMMLHLSWRLSLVLLLLIPIEFYYLYKMRPKVERDNIRVRERGADISAFFTEKIPAIKFIQSAVSEQRELDRLSVLNNSFLQNLIKLQKTEFWTSAIPTLLVSFSRACVFLIGGYWVIQDSFALGSLIAFTAYISMALGPVQSLLGLYLAWQRLTVSLDRVRYLRQQPIPVATNTYCDLPENLTGDININAISFAYSDNKIIFDDASLYIPAGIKVGIFGQTGIGKTTLLDLLQAHLYADTGTISVGNTDIATINPLVWRKRIAIVPQDTVIFRDTLANNIRYTHPAASDEDIRSVVKATELDALVNGLPHGLETLISERGMSLSGGERQRIGLARALLQQPLILILDEPTSATDSVTEKYIIQKIDMLFANTTRIIASHRKNAIVNAKMIIEIIDHKLHICEADKN